MAPRLKAAAQVDKKINKKGIWFSDQMTYLINAYARREGLDSFAAAVRKLCIVGLVIDEHVLHLNYEKFAVESLEDDKNA